MTSDRDQPHRKAKPHHRSEDAPKFLARGRDESKRIRRAEAVCVDGNAGSNSPNDRDAKPCAHRIAPIIYFFAFSPSSTTGISAHPPHKIGSPRLAFREPLAARFAQPIL